MSPGENVPHTITGSRPVYQRVVPVGFEENPDPIDTTHADYRHRSYWTCSTCGVQVQELLVDRHRAWHYA